MKKIETTRQFDKDLKNLVLTSELIDVLHALINDLPVPISIKTMLYRVIYANTENVT